jgi:hypothetical protein
MVWLDHFKWGTPRESLQKSFSGKFLSDPNTDTLGLFETRYGHPSFLMLYFIRTEDTPMLSRLTVSFDGASSDDRRLEMLFANVRDDIITHYFDPTCAEGFLPMDSKELRHSLKLTWELKDSLLTLSMRLTRDGFPRKETDVFLFVADAANDPVARMTRGCAP